MQTVIIKIISKVLYGLSILLILAFLPVQVAAEESKDVLTKTIHEQINSALKSALEKDPNLDSCAFAVIFSLKKDNNTKNWEISSIITELEERNGKKVVGSVIASIEDQEFSTDVYGKTNGSENEYVNGEEEYYSNSFSGVNVLGWLIGGALFVLLFVVVFSRFRLNLKDGQASDVIKHCNHPMWSGDNWQKNNNIELSSSEQTHQPMATHVAERQASIKPNQSTSLGIDAKPVITSHSFEGEHEIEEIKTETAPAVSVNPIVKYGQIAVLSQNELTTEEGYMSDDAVGMPFEFVFLPNMEEGSYDIADASRISFLRDINIICPFVQDFDVVSNPTNIVTISKGKLKKRGFSWVVTEKLKIKLI